MFKPKYIAEGFEEDAEKLVNEFTEKGTVEFSEFARIWRKHNFSLIFMGRLDQIETSEFVNEIYRICTTLLPSPSFYRRIGIVYLLYALYRNQIADPPIKIRIELCHWRIIKCLHVEARLKEYRTLHYVIDYLIKNSFIYVACQTLKGPLTSPTEKVTKTDDTISSLKSVYKSDLMEYSAHNNLEKLRDLHIQYLEAKKNLSGHVKVSLNPDHEVYEDLISELNKVIDPTEKTEKEVSEAVGSRRAKIKAESFVGKVNNRYGQSIDDENFETGKDLDFQEDVVKKKVTKQRRIPKIEKRVGRPSKKLIVEEEKEVVDDPDDNMDINHLIDQQHDFYLPPEEECMKVKGKPGKFYYKVSPKREEYNSSDPDNNC